MFKKTMIATALMLVVTTASATGFQLGDTNKNNNNNNNSALGVGVGVASAKAHNKNKIGVSVKNTNLGVNKNYNFDYNRNTNVGINKQGQALHNTNLIGGSSQALENVNDLSNRNYMEGQNQGQDQAQKQSQAQLQGNKQVMVYEEAERMEYDGGYTVRNVPDAIAPSVQPTTPCAIPLNGAGSGVGFGISLGTAYVDTNCEMREDVRLGLAGDAVSQNLANQVIQSRLRGHLEEVEDEVAMRMVEAKDGDTAGIFALTDY